MNRLLAALVLLAAALTAHAAAPSGGLSSVELRLSRAGYVDVARAVPDAFVDLMYARPDNFAGRVLYDSLRHAYLHPALPRLCSVRAESCAAVRRGCASWSRTPRAP